MANLGVIAGHYAKWQPRPSHQVIVRIDGGEEQPYDIGGETPEDAVAKVVADFEPWVATGAARMVTIKCGSVLRTLDGRDDGG